MVFLVLMVVWHGMPVMHVMHVMHVMQVEVLPLDDASGGGAPPVPVVLQQSAALEVLPIGHDAVRLSVDTVAVISRQGGAAHLQPLQRAQRTYA